MRIEIPDALVEQIRIIDAINSWRATAHEKDLEKFKRKLHYCHMLTQHVSDQVMSLLLKEIQKSR